MLNQLIESKNSSENSSRAGFLISTTAFVALFACCAMLWSLFAKDVVSANNNLEMNTLLPPVAIAQTEPPKPEPFVKKEVSVKKSQSAEITVPIRNKLIARTDESPQIPDKISTVQNTSKSRPNGAVLIKDGIENDPISSGGRSEDAETGNVIGDRTPARKVKTIVPVAKEEKDEPPVRKQPVVAVDRPKVETKVEPVKSIVSMGVITGKATSLPKPAYSAAAKAVGAAGAVNVQVLIDEQGNVISAKAVTGHFLLRANAESAAKNAKFSPTLLSKVPVKVSGVIVYNFVK
jgi:TonB family protein